jgi:hypothetical protein
LRAGNKGRKTPNPEDAPAKPAFSVLSEYLTALPQKYVAINLQGDYSFYKGADGISVNFFFGQS